MTATVISGEERRRRLGVRHLLASHTRTDDVSAIAAAVVALHSSDPATVYLSCAARMATPTLAAVESALYGQRSLVRHHAMRRTMWVMTRSTARNAHAAVTAKVAAGERKRTLKAIEASTDIDDPARWFDAARDEVVGLLGTDGPLTARQVGEKLPHLAIPLEFGSEKNQATLNAHTKVLQGAAFDGDLVRGQPAGRWISSEYPWSVTASWLGTELSGVDKRAGAAAMVEAWLRAFGPGTEADLVWWFGDTKTLIRTALADCEATPVTLEDGEPAWVAADDVGETEAPERWVRLLPGLDATAMGWKQRDWYLRPEIAEPLYDRFGNLGPSIWADGRIVGGWIQRDDGSVACELFESLSPAQNHLLDEARAELTLVADGTVVKPRFPARMQKQLLA